ncbi:MAG TPA: hypothetical protein VGE41_09090, partial [Verrucomicrobiae bacterium]
ERREFIQRKWGVLRKKIAQRLHRRPKGSDSQVDLAAYIDASQFPDDELKLWRVHLNAGAAYTPKPYTGRVTLLRTRGQPFLCSFDPQYGWGELATGGVDVRLLPGSHEKIFLEPDLRNLAQTLENCLAEAQLQNASHITEAAS